MTNTIANGLDQEDTDASLPPVDDGGYAHGPADDYFAPPYPYAGKVAIVTGASQGIGRHVAFGLARCGATVVVASRSAGGVETVRLIGNDPAIRCRTSSSRWTRTNLRAGTAGTGTARCPTLNQAMPLVAGQRQGPQRTTMS